VVESGLIPFLRALCALRGRDCVPAANIRVKYSDEDIVYEQWVPQRETDIVRDGLLDPGFGSGPVYFTDIDLVEARLSDWVAQKGELGRSEFHKLRGMLAGQAGLDVGQEVVSWGKGGASAVDRHDQ